jgi:hypothetical protein
VPLEHLNRNAAGLQAFQEEVKRLLLKYPDTQPLQQLPQVIEEFVRVEKGNIDKIKKRTLYSNPGYTVEDIEIAFRQVLREHFNI